MRIIWSPAARADQHRIWLFAAEHSVARADRIEARLEARAASLSGLPRQGRPIPDDMRRLSLPDIQLILYYRIEDGSVVRILRVHHTREDRKLP